MSSAGSVRLLLGEDVPARQNKTISVQSALMPNGLTIPSAGTKGTRVGGNVVYTSAGPVGTVVQPTADGGSRTR
ncbi:hypothetical protein [Streptomyces sp. NPDC002746]